jgi:hypothetical protein
MFAVTRHASPTTAKPKKVESTAANESLVPEFFSREGTMIAEHASCPVLEQRDAPDRRVEKSHHRRECDNLDRDHCPDPTDLFLNRWCGRAASAFD